MRCCRFLLDYNVAGIKAVYIVFNMSREARRSIPAFFFFFFFWKAKNWVLIVIKNLSNNFF